MKKTAFFIVFCLLASSALFSQTVVNMGSQRNLTSCDAIIYDHAGQNGNYVGGREDTLTIYPVAGAVQILFEEMDIAETDTLFIYNGVDPANDSIPLLIGSLSANWVNNSNVIQLGDQMTAATIQNPNGALTLRFVSSANTVGGTGYKLVVTCGQPCQRVHATMDMANMIPTPHFDTELNDGYYYMDFCPGDTLTFSCYGYYPDNDYSYHQSDATTIFEWSMGGDIMRGANMNTVQYAFPPGQGFDVSLTMIDQRSCQAQTPVAIRIRGSRDPLTNVSLLDDVCSGTQIPLVVGYDSSSTIVVEPITSTQTSSLSVDSTVFIPDGPNCSPPCYSSSVNFTTFPAGATITRAADILSVCINIEHSYIGDINISLVCPNSRSVLLMPDHNGVNNWAYFGIMYEPDNGCLPVDNPQGTGWNYCWSENSAYAQLDGLCYNNVGGNLSNVVDSSNMYTHVGYYTPTQSFSNLVGCPLNGLWSIQVCDTWGSDNGYVFSWELALDPALMPQDWTYEVGIDNINWSGNNIVPTSDSTAVIETETPGDFIYTFTITDDFGCEYSRDMPVRVVQTPEPSLGDDVNLCIGEQTTLDPHFNYLGTPGGIDYSWTTVDDNTEINGTETFTVSDSNEYIVTITTSNANNTLQCVKSDTINVALNPQPIANFEADLLDNCAPLNVNMTDMSTYTDGEDHDEIVLNYQWAIYNQNNEVVLSSTIANPSFSIIDGGIYSVGLIVTTPSGCADTMIRFDYLTVYPQPISDFVANPERTNLAEGGTIVFLNITDTTVFGQGDTPNWTWDYGAGGDVTHDFNGTFTYDSWGEYVVTLSVLTDKDCSSTVSHTIYIEADLIFPNVITPNGDGINDVLAIENMNPKMPNILSIYNRWGKKVYEKENYQTYMKDDILYNTEEGFGATGLSDGVYYYTFHYEGYTRAVDYHGSLTILRDK